MVLITAVHRCNRDLRKGNSNTSTERFSPLGKTFADKAICNKCTPFQQVMGQKTSKRHHSSTEDRAVTKETGKAPIKKHTARDNMTIGGLN